MDEKLNDHGSKYDKNKQLKNKYVSEYGIDADYKKSKRMLLPWWTRIIVHICCNIAIIAAATFIIIEGIQFGDSLVQKWLASLIVSFFASIILYQPFQVSFGNFY